MEGIVHAVQPFGKSVSANAFAVHIVKLYVGPLLLTDDGPRPHIDPAKWRCRATAAAGEGARRLAAQAWYISLANQLGCLCQASDVECGGNHPQRRCGVDRAKNDWDHKGESREQ